MTTAPSRACKTPLCPGLAAGGHGYCAACYTPDKARTPSRGREYDKARGSASARGYDRSWRERTRLRFLRDHPLCERCMARNVIEPANEVHHIKRKADGGSDNPSNLMALCKSCHSAMRWDYEVSDYYDNSYTG